MLGDQLAIDIQGAKDAGIKAFLVLSSLTPEYQPGDGLPVPDAVYASATDFYQAWIQR
jgi:ribonucleotide monophosphatase NagD (HAD superfamily)